MKKGFTLVELLAVIAVLALIAAIAYPIVTGLISDMKENASESQKREIIDAAKYWAQDNSGLLSDTVGDIYTISIEKLKTDGYLTNEKLRDIDTDTILKKACVKITTQEHKYTYEYFKNCQ